MILLADSGSSKTDWYLIRKDQPGISLRSEGLNPYFVSAEKADQIIQKEVVPFVFPDKINTIVFYGAGCSRNTKRDLISDVLKENFPRADIDVFTDLLGTARALYGAEAGIAGILGTGSNLCYYNGKGISDSIPSLGYLLGDEGSGASLGFSLLRAFLRQELPETISRDFTRRYGLEKEQILDAMYHQPDPNRRAAAFTVFLKEKLDDNYIREMILNHFRYFVHKDLKPLAIRNGLTSASFTGSVAFHFEQLLKEAATEYGIHIQRVEASPIHGLVGFHTPLNW
ncbi:MAG TPA: ATPase [Bacteroidales bacterium]|nr:ATPase [Bacteroidales bacterium]HSA42794.1 ATPase [Bacteroidales bacterium]